MATASGTVENVGSASYNQAIPILTLPGRAGLDVTLTLYYDSDVWTIASDGSGKTATFNADRDFPSYGFKLGYGYLEWNGAHGSSSAYILTEADGTKRSLNYNAANGLFVSSDSSYIDYNNGTNILRYPDGKQLSYQMFSGAKSSLFRPVLITDKNGNFITLAYTGDGESLTTIVDTLGRQITFNYDGSGRLLSITQGTRTRATFGWAVVPLTYNFSGISASDSLASGSNINVLNYVQFPDSTGYVFQYGDWGIVRTIQHTAAATSPLSAPIRSSLTYNYPSASTALSDHPTYTTETQTYSTKSADGAESQVSATWTHHATITNGVMSSYSLIDPAGTTTTDYLNTSGTYLGLLSSVVTSDSAGHALRTNTYNWQNGTGGPQVYSIGTSLNDTGLVSLAYIQYDQNGNVTSASEYDYDGQVKRTTSTTYSTASNHINKHLLHLPTQVIVQDGNSNVIARSDITYDGTSPTSQPGAVNHNDNFGNAGNVTQVKRYTNAASASGPILRNYVYDTLGNLRAADVDCCNSESWTYSPNYQYAYPTTITLGGLLPTNLTYNFDSGTVNTSQDANSQTTTYFYDSSDRLIGKVLPNNVTATTSYTDNVAEPTVAQSNTANNAVQWDQFDGAGHKIRSELRNGNTTLSATQTEYDTDGRVYRTSNPFTGSPQVWTVYSYDALSRVNAVQMPDGSPYSYSYSGNTTTTTDPAGKQRRSYTDALGRLVRVDEPGWGDALAAKGTITISGDELSVQYDCPGEICVTVYDSGTITLTVNGHSDSVTYATTGRVQKILPTPTSIAAALANAINQDAGASVYASASGGTLSVTARSTGYATNGYSIAVSTASTMTAYGFPSSGSFSVAQSGPTLSSGQDATAGENVASLNTPKITTYQYDAVDDLTGVTQGYLGSVQGQVQPGQNRSYIYDSLGRVLTSQTPESGTVSYTYTGFGAVSTRQDARGVVTTYSYDSMNRPYQVTYNVGASGVPATPTVTYTYGTSPQAFNNGRLTAMTDGVGGESYTFSNLGQVTGITKVINGTTYQLGYQFNPDGTLASATYPAANGGSQRVVSQTYDQAARLQQISSGGVNFITVEAGDYNPAQQLAHLTYGSGVEGNFTFNSQLQVASIRYHNNNPQDLLNLAYSYTTVPGGIDNNGQVRSIQFFTSPGVESTASSENFQYDASSRLSTANTSDLNANDPGTWRLQWGYDRFGNRLTQTLTAGSLSVTQPQLTVSPVTNCITGGFVCDANGNLRQDGLHTYTYDAENRLVNVDATGGYYQYDGNGLRVVRTASNNTTVSLYSGSKPISEYVNGTMATEYIYAGSQQLARIPNGGTSVYSYADHLSTRVQTDSSGNVIRQYGHLPFGETWYETGTSDKWKFTGQERDVESGLDHFWYRNYSSRFGRWYTPDPAGLAVADPANPQSVDPYTYAFNKPLSFIDINGLCVSVLIVNSIGTSYWDVEELGDCQGLFGGSADRSKGRTPLVGVQTSEIATANDQLNQLLNRLSTCPAASVMVSDLKQLQASGKLTPANLGTADGGTSFTGAISIDSTNGITAHNLGHEWWHTMQRNAILSGGQAGASFNGGPLAGALAGQLGWAGARLYNSVAGFISGTPGFGPLDKEAEAVGQRISSQCSID